MNDLKTNTITLPSKGALYGGLLPEGRVTVKVMTAYDQSILFAQGSAEDRITKLIANTCELPKGLTAGKLLSVDRMAILLAVRTYTFGPHYEFSYNCQHCKAPNKHSVNVAADLSEVGVAEGMVEPFEVVLPTSGQTVKLRFLRGEDEEAVAKHTKRMAMQSMDAGDVSTIHRLARLIVAIDGDENIDIVKREAFVRNLSALDANIMEDETSVREPGIDLTVRPECKRCEQENEFKMPFDRDYFRPTTVRPKAP